MQWGKPRHCEAGCRSSPGMPKLNRQVDCFVANAPRNDVGRFARNDGGGALLAMMWGALLAMTMKAGFDIGKKQEVNYGLL